MGALISHVLGLALLVSLYFLPIDMTTAGFFVIGFAVFLSALGVLWKRSRRPSALFVAFLWVVLFPGACANQAMSWSAASKQVVALAERADAHCRREGVCPSEEELCGAEGCGTAGTTVRHRMRYSRAKNEQSFAVWVRLSIDDQISAEGGVSRPLERVTRSDNSVERAVIEKRVEK